MKYRLLDLLPKVRIFLRVSVVRRVDYLEKSVRPGWGLLVGANFVNAVKCVELRVVIVSKSLALRENVPNPVPHHSAVLHFLEGGGVVAFLCFKEAIEVVDFLRGRHSYVEYKILFGSVSIKKQRATHLRVARCFSLYR